MSDEADETEEAPKKASKMPLILGLVLAIAGGGGGFFAVQAGLLGGSDSAAEEEKAAEETPAEKDLAVASFVAIDPLVISLPGGRGHLRFAAQLEVPPEHVADVEAVKPRVVDVLNSYLRAVEIAELEDPTALMRLRGQMLRRVQVVVGDGRVTDILIMEFVLS